MSDNLLSRTAWALAKADGNHMAYEACKINPSQERDDGCFAKYMNAAEQFLRTSGIADEFYRLRCQNHGNVTQRSDARIIKFGHAGY